MRDNCEHRGTLYQIEGQSLTMTEGWLACMIMSCSEWDTRDWYSGGEGVTGSLSLPHPWSPQMNIHLLEKLHTKLSHPRTVSIPGCASNESRSSNLKFYSPIQVSRSRCVCLGQCLSGAVGNYFHVIPFTSLVSSWTVAQQTPAV